MVIDILTRCFQLGDERPARQEPGLESKTGQGLRKTGRPARKLLVEVPAGAEGKGVLRLRSSKRFTLATAALRMTAQWR
jgi:hypothetical protein